MWKNEITANGSSVDPNQTLITCSLAEDVARIFCNGTEYDLYEEKLGPHETLFWIYLGAYIFLVLFAGLMAGLTIAILSLDMTSLKVLQAAGTEENRRCAKRIIPMVKRRHLVLITLVLANAASVETMPIFMDRISDPVTAVLVSSTAVLIFGEVLPQAICSRYGLKVGYYLAWLVWTLVSLFFVIALPFSHLLDILLGKESGTFYGRKELEALVDIHGPKPKSPELFQTRKAAFPASCAGCRTVHELASERLSTDEVLIIKGALTMTSKMASTAMVKLEDVFMLPIDTVFDSHSLKMIFELGHSRIPVYDVDRTNILGVFLTKRLIAIDPNAGMTLKQLINEHSTSVKFFYQGISVNEKMPLYQLLNRFQTGKMSHMAFVTAKKENAQIDQIVGIVTLEDVIEELLQEEIFDEVDVNRTKCSTTGMPISILKFKQPALLNRVEPGLPSKPRNMRKISLPSMSHLRPVEGSAKPLDIEKSSDIEISVSDMPTTELTFENDGGSTVLGVDYDTSQNMKTPDNNENGQLTELSAINLNESFNKRCDSDVNSNIHY